jgi:hypothetical protein
VAITFQFWGGLFLAALVAIPAAPRDRTPELRARFERETNPVHKAQLMQKLGSAEFKDIEKYVAASQFSRAAEVLHQYRSEVELCSKELDATGINAEKKPKGFKQLQFSVRDALRHLDRLISTMTTDEQIPFRRDRDSLEELNSHLLQQLFPREQNQRHHGHHFPFT